MGALDVVIDKNYVELINNLKNTIQMAQIKAHRVVNIELIQMNWLIGKDLLERQNLEVWGSKYLDQVSIDLSAEFPGMRGFSRRSLEYMRKFYTLFKDVAIAQQPAAQLGWGSIMILLDKNCSSDEFNWYAREAINNGWSRNILNLMTKQDLYNTRNSPNKITNFKDRLPAVHSDIVQEMFRDSYCLEFLNIQKPVQERDLENALVHNIKDFLLQMGQGYAFIGNQHHINVGGDDFYIDCLFYNTKLH
jgi:predicted nuclease of restriction endonuclease-like (RecB) superfamily